MRFLDTFNRWFGAVTVAANCAASFWIFVMMFIVVADIFMRFVFSAPLDGTIEVIQASIIVVLYLQIAYALRSGRLTRSDAFFNWLLRRKPWMGQVLGLVFNAAGAALMITIMWPGWGRWVKALEAGDYEGIPGVFTFPRWPAFFVLWLGCGLMAVQFVLLVIDGLLALAGRRPLARLESERPSHAAEDLA